MKPQIANGHLDSGMAVIWKTLPFFEDPQSGYPEYLIGWYSETI
jgi:hypothetical protein